VENADEETIATINVLCCTVDVALKGVAKHANYLANLLFRHSSPRAAIMDELQRTPLESFVGLAEHTETVVAIGDPNQRVVSVRAWRSAGLATRHVDHDEDEAPTQRSNFLRCQIEDGCKPRCQGCSCLG
jgi:hypothetical protein